MTSRNLVILMSAVVFSSLCTTKSRYGRYTATVAEAMDLISTSYIEPTQPRDLLEGAMEGIVGKLDRYSGYISAQSLKPFHEQLDQEFSGVGIVVEFDQEADRLMVLSPIVGTPAFEAGIQAGDMILAIDGRDTKGLKSNDAVGLIRGRKGTSVELTILHVGEVEPETLAVTRTTVEVEYVLGHHRNDSGEWNFFLEDRPDIGYVRITEFGDKTPRKLSQALESLNQRGIRGLIMDLRGNPGGLLESARDTCDLFLSDGQIVTSRDRDGNIQRAFSGTRGTTIFDARLIPVAVLVDRYSASASEIVAACLQDHDLAGIVGERTWGKGTVQNVVPIEGGRSALRLTTATYWRPSLRNIHRSENASEDDEWGVRPNDGWEVKLSEEQHQRLVQQLRARYIVQGPVNSEPISSPNETDAEDVQEEFEDPQLLKAIEYVESKMIKRAAA